jgi:tetratricopeptide (TPR) repeat protein
VAFAVAALVGVSFHEAQLATATTRILRSERLAEQTAGVAARSLGRTGLLLEQMIRQSRPDDSTNLELLRQVREEFFHFPLRDDPIDSLRSRVHGLCRVADVMCESKHYEDALACHAMTLEVLDELTTRQPTDAQATVERLHVMHMQRVCLHRLGRMHEAADAARRSLELIERTSADLPDREREIIRAKLDLGVFLNEIRQHDEAAENLDEAFVRLRALRENRPGEISLAEQQAHALLSAVMGAANAGRPEECRRWSEQLTCEISDFLATAPTDSLSIAQRSQLTKMAGVGFSQLARLAYESGDEDEAIFLLEKQRQLCLAFVATLPPGKVDPVHNELVDAEMQTASLLAERGWGERAQAAVDRAGKTAAFLLDRQPGVWDHAALQARVFQGEAELATARGDRAVAGDRYAKIIALMEPHLANPTCRGATEALLRSARDGLLDLTENRPAHSENSSPP